MQIIFFYYYNINQIVILILCYIFIIFYLSIESGPLRYKSLRFSCTLPTPWSIDRLSNRPNGYTRTVAKGNKSTLSPTFTISASGNFPFKFFNSANTMLHKFESNLSIWNGNKVWLMLGISLVVLALVLTLLSTVYLRYVNDSTRSWLKRPLMDFANLLHNSSFLLSHLTNQGIR